MIIIFLKYFFIFFFCIYIHQKSIHTFKISFEKIFILALVLSLITCALSIYINGLTYIFPLFLLWIIISIDSLNPQLTFVTVIISFTISFCTYAISSFLIILFTFPIFTTNSHFPLIAFLSGILQTIILKGIFSIKRLRKGVPFSPSSSFINCMTFLCLFFIFFILYTAFDYTLLYTKILVLSTFILFFAFLIYWWQAQITKSYRRSLELRELESLRTEIAEKDAVIQKLMKDNENLARISHRDNSLISALKDSTVKYLSTDYKSPAEAMATRDKLISNINTISAGRNSLPHSYGKRTAREFDTGLSLLDDLLHHMDKEALEQDIMFSVHFGTLLKDFVPENVSESDLTHTVDDLLKNAFKSIRTCESRAVQLQFYKLGKHLVIEVADNGIPFEVRSLVNMGIEQLTTYEDGSGIGLMDIWSTKENYRATYHLDEYATSSPFSKKISLTFDKKNRYTIRTYRKEEILQMSRRADLQVYDDQE